MDLDDLLALAESHRASPLELIRARRAARAVQREYDRSLAEGYEIIADVDLVDPLAADVDEASRISRTAQLAKLGTVTWIQATQQLTWSDEMAMIFGYPPGTLRLTPKTLGETIHPADVASVRAAVEKAWSQRNPGEVTFRVVQRSGSLRYVHCHIEILTAAGEASGIIATGEDVTAIELARQERARLATRKNMLCADLGAQDFVTGLPARAYFTDEVDRTRRTNDGTLLVIATEPAIRLPNNLEDEDHDQLSADIAGLLQDVTGADAICGLAGPGLWGVLLPVCDEDRDSVATFATRLVDRFRRHLFTVQHKTLRLNTWAGAVRFAHGSTATGFELLIDAEHAAREARRNGDSSHILQQPPPREKRLERSRSRIRTAVSADRFTLYAQPILDLNLNQVTRHEILLRVCSDTGEPIAPWAFLDVAEWADEILAVDKWVIDRAIELIGQGTQTSHYQVNISGRSLSDPDLLPHVTKALHLHSVKPDCITFEITETALIENRNEALAFATGIRKLGCHLALDDFGTGYAALAYLKYLPADLVKIDGVFVVDLCDSPTDQALVSKLAELCHSLGIRVAAEYVQDQRTIDLLRSYGVDFAQGYQIGRPKPIAASLHQKPKTIELDIHIPTQRTAIGQ